jgi:cell filamentation protein
MSFTLADGKTLKNKVGATSHDDLEAAEHPILAIRLLELREGLGPAPTFDQAHLQALHKHLFQDVFEWAGELRHKTFTFADGSQAATPAMHKQGGKDFAIGNQIDRGLDGLMSDLKAQNYLRGLDRNTFTNEAADAFARLNSVHPFREGNGRTQREFFTALGEQAGHPLNFDVISAERMTVVSVAAHERGDLEPMRRMFAEIADPERVQALALAQNAIQRFSEIPHQEHETVWSHIYMATTEPGETYSGRFSGAAGQNFMMQRGDGSIIIGNVIDLPEPRPQSGAELTFTATDPRQPVQELSQAPLIGAVHEWPQSVDETVASRIEARPEIQTFRGRLAEAVQAVWQNPQAVLAELQQRIEVEQRPVADFAQEIRNNPESIGELKGSRNIIGRDDATRQNALASVPLAVAAMHDYGQLRGTLTKDMTREEERFRERMREPVKDLSPQAQTLVGQVENAPSHEVAALLARGEHTKALQELRGFVEDVRLRFKAQGSKELDQGRLSQALPNVAPEKLQAFSAGFARAEAIESRIGAIEQANTQSHAQSHTQTQSVGKGFEI